MANPMVDRAPSGLMRLLAAVMTHTQRWGMVWFGLVFWGSVLNAIATDLWPDTAAWLLVTSSAAIGLTLGLVAKGRGRCI